MLILRYFVSVFTNPLYLSGRPLLFFIQKRHRLVQAVSFDVTPTGFKPVTF